MKKVLFVQTNYPGFLRKFDSKFANQNLSYKELKSEWSKEKFGQSDFYSQNIKHGWLGEEVIINDWLLQSTWANEHGFSISGNEPFWSKYVPESVKNLLGTRSWIKKILFKQIEEIKPDVLYMHDMSVLSVDDIAMLKKKKILIAGQIACPLPLNREPLKHFDLIVSSFPHYVRMFRDWGVKSEYMRWCFEDTILKQIKPEKRVYDVVFIGGFGPAHSEGNRVMEKLAKQVKVDFWGYGVDTLAPNSKIKENYHGEAWGMDMYRIMNQAKIVVNRHINVAGNVANNMRMFDVTGMGALLITDDKPNMDEFFVSPTEVVTYKTTTDLVKKVKYYLNHESLRNKIALAGQKRTLTEHTYKIRMSELAKILDTHVKNK